MKKVLIGVCVVGMGLVTLFEIMKWKRFLVSKVQWRDMKNGYMNNMFI